MADVAAVFQDGSAAVQLAVQQQQSSRFLLQSILTHAQLL
jgi:hypothetical protein